MHNGDWCSAGGNNSLHQVPDWRAKLKIAADSLVQKLFVSLQVAREVYSRCLTGVLKSKTRVLITNQLQFVSGADHIICMSEGSIEEQGTYEQLVQAGQGFAQLMAQAEVRIASHTKSITN